MINLNVKRREAVTAETLHIQQLHVTAQPPVVFRFVFSGILRAFGVPLFLISDTKSCIKMI